MNMTAEGQVRAAWDWVHVHPPEGKYTTFIVRLARTNPWLDIGQFEDGSEASAWQAALEFTLEQKEKIRLIDREIETVGRYREQYYPSDAEDIKRTLARLQAIRKELARGLKEK
jgi:hypothetical protein